MAGVNTGEIINFTLKSLDHRHRTASGHLEATLLTPSLRYQGEQVLRLWTSSFLTRIKSFNASLQCLGSLDLQLLEDLTSLWSLSVGEKFLTLGVSRILHTIEGILILPVILLIIPARLF